MKTPALARVATSTFERSRTSRYSRSARTISPTESSSWLRERVALSSSSLACISSGTRVVRPRTRWWVPKQNPPPEGELLLGVVGTVVGAAAVVIATVVIPAPGSSPPPLTGARSWSPPSRCSIVFRVDLDFQAFVQGAEAREAVEDGGRADPDADVPALGADLEAAVFRILGYDRAVDVTDGGAGGREQDREDKGGRDKEDRDGDVTRLEIKNSFLSWFRRSARYYGFPAGRVHHAGSSSLPMRRSVVAFKKLEADERTGRSDNSLSVPKTRRRRRAARDNSKGSSAPAIRGCSVTRSVVPTIGPRPKTPSPRPSWSPGGGSMRCPRRRCRGCSASPARSSRTSGGRRGGGRRTARWSR